MKLQISLIYVSLPQESRVSKMLHRNTIFTLLSDSRRLCLTYTHMQDRPVLMDLDHSSRTCVENRNLLFQTHRNTKIAYLQFSGIV